MERKWLIPELPTELQQDERAYWEQVHRTSFSSHVWSMTGDTHTREKLISTLNHFSPLAEKLYIPGCGTHTFLQEHLIEALPNLSGIVCSDFLGVIDAIDTNPHPEKITYTAFDTAACPYTSTFDAVLIVNAILSQSDLRNREMLDACANALKPGGVLLGFFPTIFCDYEMLMLDESVSEEDRSARVDLESNRVFERNQNVYEVIYSPLRLRRVLREAGLSLASCEIFFCDTEHYQQETKKHYGVSDSDNVMYLLFVVAEKP